MAALCIYEEIPGRSTMGQACLRIGEMETRKLRRILRRVLSAPTAPFHEYHVRDAIVDLLFSLEHVHVEEDSFGNILATYRRGRKRGHFVFGAHMDHPGWVRANEGEEAEYRAENGTSWNFLGGVPEDYRKAPKIACFGEFAMWDLPVMDEHDGRVYSRACDDLVNCATMVCLLTELERQGAEVTVHAVFTRAEEVGFVGATRMAREWGYGEAATFVSLETSAPVPEASFGAGPVLRVGDRLSIFDHHVTGFFSEVAGVERIGVQRLLLNRGACEASAFQAFGIRTAGLSILLGNYHNCGERGRIEAEFVSLADVKAMVRLIVAATLEAGKSGVRGRATGNLRKRLVRKERDHGKYIRSTEARFGERL
ncbi:MAG: M20/M25/M40 family metallo-hydrolase [Verrucomicrobiota bacterium]